MRYRSDELYAILCLESHRHHALIGAALTWLAANAAAVVLINLEDLWLETAPQNLPGTGTERPNWRRRAPYSLEQLASRPSVVETLRLVADARARGRGRL